MDETGCYNDGLIHNLLKVLPTIRFHVERDALGIEWRCQWHY